MCSNWFLYEFLSLLSVSIDFVDIFVISWLYDSGSLKLYIFDISLWYCFLQLDVDITTHIHVKQDGPKRRLFEMAFCVAIFFYLNQSILLSHHIKYGKEWSKVRSRLVLLRGLLDVSFDTALYFHVTSLLYIETADRPGLLVEVIKIIADVNIDVESAEIDTEVCHPPISLSLSLSLCILLWYNFISSLDRVWLPKINFMSATEGKP